MILEKTKLSNGKGYTMKRIVWNASVLIASIFLTSGVIMVLQMVSHYFFPMPSGIIGEIKDLETFIKLVPVSRMLFVELTYVLGSLAGGYAIGALTSSNQYIFAGILGLVMTGANVANIMNIPHPTWMIVLTMCTFIPCALLGSYLARSR